MSTWEAKETGLPLSRASAVASSDALAATKSANRSKHRARSTAGVAAQSGNARFAAATAWSTSAFPDRGMEPYTEPLPGDTRSRVEAVGCSFPSMKFNACMVTKLPRVHYLRTAKSNCPMV